MFNQLKSGFHNHDIYTYNHPSEHDNLLSGLNQAEDVTVVDCSSTVFKQWGKYVDKGYTGIKDGQVLVNHVFWTTQTNGETKLIIKTDETELAEHNSVQDLKKRGCSGPHRKLWLASMSDPIAPIQLTAIKQAELYNKWRQYLPEQYRDIMCPKPPDDVLEKVAADKRQKRQAQENCSSSS